MDVAFFKHITKTERGQVFLSEIILEKSKRNLKRALNGTQGLGRFIRQDNEEVIFCAIGGYNLTYQLLLESGVSKSEIATYDNMLLTQNFITETHGKKVLLIRRSKYLTKKITNTTGTGGIFETFDFLSTNSFESNALVYQTAQREMGKNKWRKPLVVIFDDPNLNLQFEDHRFVSLEIGFVQINNRYANPKVIIEEIANIKETEKMMFAKYQDTLAEEADIIKALDKIKENALRRVDDSFYFKPTELKKYVGSASLYKKMKDISELGIEQLTSNKKIGKENARWVIVPDYAFDFKGRQFKDDEELFDEELAQEEIQEQAFIKEQERKLNEIMSIRIPINVKQGVHGNDLNFSGEISLNDFIEDVDQLENDVVGGIGLLNASRDEKEYKEVKLNNLAYFLDGYYKDDKRLDSNYTGGKRLVSIDVDEGDLSRTVIENKLEQIGLFGIVYPTAKYYYDTSARWRIILMADENMNKGDYKSVVEGVSKMLGIEIDAASKKLSQLMGLPLKSSDISKVVGTMISVSQFKDKVAQQNTNVVDFKSTSKKSLLEFNHSQARLIKEALATGVTEGSRNESYRQMALYLHDVLNNQDMEFWHDEAQELLEKTKGQALLDGLDEKEIEVIYR